MTRSLEDRVIVITGASSGIGAATALACARSGMHVVLAARREQQLNEVADKIGSLGRRAVPVVCDVRRDEDVDNLIGRTSSEFGRLDAMFANAGYGIFASVMATTDEQMRDIFETNFFGTIRCIQAAVPVMRQMATDNRNSGHVLICSSAASEIALPMYGFYSATKSAQDSIGGALRAELSTENIYVSTVHPVLTRTEFSSVAARVSNRSGSGLDAPNWMTHSAKRVANGIVRCLRRPRPEVWPSTGARMGIALTTALPGLTAWMSKKLILRRYMKHLSDEQSRS